MRTTTRRKACGFMAIETYKGACMQMSEEKRGCCCGKKTTMRSEEERKKLINRLSRIEGQIRGIKGMLENDAY